MRIFNFWLTTSAGAGHAARTACLARRRVDVDCRSPRRAPWHVCRSSSTPQRPLVVDRQRRHRQFQAWRCSDFSCPYHFWGHRRARSHRRPDSHMVFCPSCERPSRDSPESPGRSAKRSRDGHDAARAAPPGRAAARATVDRRRRSRRGGRGSWLGNDCRCNRRGRSRSAHLPRPLDGRFDRDSCRRHSRRRCWRLPWTGACCGWSGTCRQDGGLGLEGR